MGRVIKHSLIEKLPTNHFGKVGAKVLQGLLNGSCYGVYGLPGYGMEFFAKHILFRLGEQSRDLHIYLVNNELDVDKVRDLKRFLANLTGNTFFDLLTTQDFLRNNKVVVILGEVLSPRDIPFFKFLNSLRWLEKKNFCVLTVANYTLFTQLDIYLSIAPDVFYPIERIDSFNLEGTKRIINFNNREFNWQIPPELSGKIHNLSGGNPAITKYICMALYEEGQELLNILNMLVTTQPLKRRLDDISDLIPQLNIKEQGGLGLIDSKGVLFSELLKIHVSLNTSDEVLKLFPKVTATEHRILTYMFQVPGKVISKEQLSILLGQDLDSYSEWAIYKSMQRLRTKVFPKIKIETIRKQGWMLVV